MEMRTKKVPRVEPGKAYEVGLGRPTLIDDCHALPVSGITGYRLVDRKGVRGEMTPGHHRIAPDHPAGGDRRAQYPVRPIRFCHDKEAGGLLVQTVDHSGPLRLPLRGERPTATEQRVHESPAPVAGRGVDDHPRRLIDDEEILVLVDDADRNVLPDNRTLFHLRDLHSHHFTELRSVAGPLLSPVHEDVPLRDQRRCLRARQLRSLGNKQIEADIAVRLDRKLSGVAQG